MTSARELQDYRRQLLIARERRRMEGAGGLNGRSGIVRPVEQKNAPGKGFSVPMPEPLTNGGQVVGSAQLLCMSVVGDSIASGGDYVAFSNLLAQQGFEGVTAAGASWTHPTGGVYVLEYAHAWDSYDGGGTIQLEIDGSVATSTTIAEGSAGTGGRGSLLYVAAAGSVGKIKVTQTSGSAQTCDATVWVGISDPTIAATVGAANVILFIDDVQVASASGDVGVSFSTVTALMGEVSGGTVTASEFVYDEVKLLLGAADQLSNGGFESAILTPSGTAAAVGNWRPQVQGAASVARTGSLVYAGTQAGRVAITAGTSQGGFFHQDVSLSPGTPFDLEARVRPVNGTQILGLWFDWDRSTGAAHSASITISPSATSFSAFGLSGSGPALPYGEWSDVRLQVGVTA